MTELEHEILALLTMSAESTDLLLEMLSDSDVPGFERSMLESAPSNLLAHGLVEVSDAPGRTIAQHDPTAPGANERWWELTPVGRAQLES